jgi:hypothetical protein
MSFQISEGKPWEELYYGGILERVKQFGIWEKHGQGRI